MGNNDTTQVRYGEALFTNVFTICGVRLRPFSLGHLILLETLSNPLIHSEKIEMTFEESIGHFFIALLICGMTYEDAVILLTDEKIFSEEIKRFCDNLVENMKIEPDWNIPYKLTAFNEYMKKHLEMPYYDEKTTNTESPSGTDWKSSIFVIFKKMGYTESEILNMPLRKLFLEWATFAESEGAIKVMNSYEANQIKTLKKFGRK